MPILNTLTPDPFWLPSALAAASPLSKLTYLQVSLDTQRRAVLRLAVMTAILWCHWEQHPLHQPVPLRPTQVPEFKDSETSTSPSPSPSPLPPPQTPASSPHTPIPEHLITNVIIASSLNHVYTTSPAIPSVKTENTEAEDIATMIDNGKELVSAMIWRVDALLSSMEPIISEEVYEKLVTRLVRCHICWHNPALETQQPHGLDSVQEDRVGRRILVTLHSRTVNPWLFYMVGDWRKINKHLLFIHHKLNEMQLDVARLLSQH